MQHHDIFHRGNESTHSEKQFKHLAGRVGWILRKLQSNAKQLEAELKNGVAYKTTCIHYSYIISKPCVFIYNLSSVLV